MDTKKEHKLLTAGLERLLQNESAIGEEYHALAEMLEGLPAGLFLAWVVIEQEAHRSLLINIIHSLKQTAQKGNADRADGIEMGRETMLCWVKRLRTNEHAVIAACRSLKSQAGCANGDLLDPFLDALVMDSEKHQRFLSAVEEAIENIMMNRPQ